MIRFAVDDEFPRMIASTFDWFVRVRGRPQSRAADWWDSPHPAGSALA
jgi:hypothetical protein